MAERPASHYYEFMQNTAPDALHFYASPYGVVSDHRVDLQNDQAYGAALDWKQGLDGHGVDRVETAEGVLRFHVNGNEPFALPLHEEPLRVSLGGNTWNTWNAVMRVVGSLAPEHLKKFPFHGIKTPKLIAGVDQLEEQHAELSLPSPSVLLRITEGARIRCNHVLNSPHADDGHGPIYVERTPLPRATGTFPDAPWVFVSSSGPDLYDEILAHRRQMEARGETPHLHLAPGSAQVRRGIPKEILQGVHFLSCNWGEAVKLAQRLDSKVGDDVSPFALTNFFGNLGVREVRITDGTKGVYAVSGPSQTYTMVHSFDRGDAILRELALLHGVVNEGMPTWTNPDLTGCGDTRLGTELALRKLGIGTLPQQLRAANAMAALQTFNPASNIGNFSLDLIKEVVERVVNRSWMPHATERMVA